MATSVYIKFHQTDVFLSAFATEDLSKDFKDLELGKECLPTQRSLGVCWNLHSDEFTFRVAIENKPFTRLVCYLRSIDYSIPLD